MRAPRRKSLEGYGKRRRGSESRRSGSTSNTLDGVGSSSAMSDFSIGEGAMGAKAEALAKQFESKAQEATAALEKLSDADWKKVTEEEEKWTVGVTAHHMAGAHEPISNIVRTIASGQSMPNFTMDMLHAANAKHAKDSA